MRPLSHTQISLYRSCPLCYKLQYIDGLKPKDKGYFSFGTVMHQCAEYFFAVKVPPPPSLEEVLQFYEQNWLSEGYESPEQEANYKAYGREILKRFWDIHHTDFKMPLATERQFNVDIEGVRLRGVIDRVDKLDTGGISIVDYKTSKQLFTSDYLSRDLQLTLYQLAAEQTWHLPVEKLTLYHLRSNTPCTCEPRSQAALDEARQIVIEVANNIAQGKFEPMENDYCPCDFPEYCPYYRQRYVEVTAEPEALDILRGNKIEDVVQRFVSLQSRIKALELEFNDVRQMVIDFCQSKGFNRIFGKEYAITCKMVERSGYDEEKVKAILEPEGLWQQVLGFDQSLLKKLLENEDLPKGLRDRLKSLERAVSTFPMVRVKRLVEDE